VARKLVGLSFAADSTFPAAGAVVQSGDSEFGRVTSATWSPALARPIALGYVHRDFVDPGTRVSVAGADGVVAMLPMA
jgi:glycine cleavage system aminomethyltransferase T